MYMFQLTAREERMFFTVIFFYTVYLSHPLVDYHGICTHVWYRVKP